jgi:hypothetical protein
VQHSLIGGGFSLNLWGRSEVTLQSVYAKNFRASWNGATERQEFRRVYIPYLISREGQTVCPSLTEWNSSHDDLDWRL